MNKTLNFLNKFRYDAAEHCAEYFGKQRIRIFLPQIVKKGFDDNGHANPKFLDFLESNVQSFLEEHFEKELKDMSEKSKQ